MLNNFTTPLGSFRTAVLDGDPVTVAVLVTARRCACGAMAMMVINRMGKTRCTSCDRRLVEERKTS